MALARPGTTATYTLNATVTASPATVRNTITVTAPAGVGDTNTANNSATDDDLLICSAYTPLLPDGRRTDVPLAGAETRWFLATLRATSSYSLEVVDATGLVGGTAPSVTVYRGDDGCTGRARRPCLAPPT